ncbi:hypothetical protein [Azospirillum canadense]|uniref:hypothetical protein n=1 Tax=Azospirillum canadense TaxID=403962 RepID=UPI0022268CDE|nr:hypothetical protein [Azospirillum canadense]MCW2242576.1 hypothetical protein [Azospirillum canadense]
MHHRQDQRRWDAQPRAIKDPRPQNATATDPLVLATSLLDGARTRAALLKAVEARVKADAEERRHFAAAAGRVRGLSGDQALVQAVRNYLQDLARSAANDRTATVVWLAQTVATLTGTGVPNGAHSGVTVARDLRAAAEALFRPRGRDDVSVSG